MTIPNTQYAVQLVGPSELILNQAKPVDQPGAHQVLAQVECVGLCFSDLKLLKQFSEHARKSEVLRGMDLSILKQVPSYRPNLEPTVPGHEAVCRIVAVGQGVTRYTVGQRVLIQTDYRWLRTAGSNAAFGYNFEGALQEYVLMDERVIIDPDTGDDFLIPVPENLSRSGIALVEPWACVESSYITEERRTVLAGGKLLIVAEAGHVVTGLDTKYKPAQVTLVCADAAQAKAVDVLGVPVTHASSVADLPNAAFDDILYFGAKKATLDVINDKLGTGGIMNVVLGGKAIGELVHVGVGRVHYGLTRWIGTPGSDASESYSVIPVNGEIRDQEKAIVIGAGGPMGQMHTIRLVCAGKQGVCVTATDFDNARLESLGDKANPKAKTLGVGLRLVNPKESPLDGETFSYYAIMAPVGPLVAQAVKASQKGTLINVFAGIPAPVKQDLDLDQYIKNQCFMFGTSGSRMIDMKIVLEKTIAGQLDTDCSVDAVTGMAGAIDGISAVENRTLAGKIIVYPAIKAMGLTPLGKLKELYPSVAERMNGLLWTKAAEEELLQVAK